MPWGHDLVALVALFSLLLYMVMIWRVGRARYKYGVKAPATTGHEDFERVYRVHYNTLEQLPVYLVSLFLFATYVQPLVAAGLGVVWIAGRVIFMLGYTKAADRRSAGFAISAVAMLLLFAGALGGVAWSFVT